METMSKPRNQDETPQQENLTFTRLFASWVNTENASLVLAASLPPGLCLIGRQKEGKVLFSALGQEALTAVAAGPDGNIWVAGKNFLHEWENATRTGGYKFQEARLYVPRLRILTSDLGALDMAVDGHNKLLLASSAYSVVGRATTQASFELIWKPPFVTNLARDNRCGLSGLGLYDQDHHCVTMWGRSNEPDGWRKDFAGGGCVMLLKDSSVYCEGLCLPRAPRWRGEELYLLNAGTAEFGKVDPGTKRFVPVCQCPGYPTGLALHRGWAAISVSATPPPGTADLEVPARAAFAAAKTAPFSGVVLVDLQTGDITHHAYTETEGVEMNGVAVLPGCPTAVAMSADNPHLENLVTVPRPPQTTAGPTEADGSAAAAVEKPEL